MAMRNLIQRARRLALRRFNDSEQYWVDRYRYGGDSGAGSYGRLAEFKARVLNDLVARHRVETVIEFGCGDGNQVSLAEYPQYFGLDVSPAAVDQCRLRFLDDDTKTFALMADYAQEKADLALSLDVIYHLVEDETFEAYMRSLFAAGKRFVIIYSTNSEVGTKTASHVRHRLFMDWVEESAGSQWQLVSHIPNDYPEKIGGYSSRGSSAEFYVYERSSN